MKKIISCIIFIAVMMIFTVGTYAGYKPESNRNNGKVKESQFHNKSVKKSRMEKSKGRKKGKPINLTYQQSENLTDKEITTKGKVDSNYGVYDVYNEETSDLEYIYLSGTDQLCGFSDKNYEIDDSKRKIAETEAVVIATQYLKDLDLNTKEYAYDHVMYVDWGQFYDIYFVKSVGGIKTDDEIRIWVTVDGQVVSYSALMYGCYDDVEFKQKQVERAMNHTTEQIAEKIKETRGKVEVKDQEVKYLEDDIVLETKISYQLSDGIHSIARQEVIEVKLQ